MTHHEPTTPAARRLLVAFLAMLAVPAMSSACSRVESAAPTTTTTITTTTVARPSITIAPTTITVPTTPTTLPPTTLPPTTIAPTTEPPLRSIGADAPLRGWVGGDSLPAYVITALNGPSADGALLDLSGDARISSSIVRPSFLDWQQQLALVLDGPSPPEAVVFMIGGNDNQPMTDAEGNSLATLSPEWLVEYRRRVAALMDLTARPDTRMLWIGLPPPRDGIRLELNPTLNGIFFTEAELRPWVSFLDIGQLLSDADGNYAPRLTGPDGGDPVTVRPRDGVHITYAGSRWVADLVWEWMVTSWSIPPTP